MNRSWVWAASMLAMGAALPAQALVEAKVAVESPTISVVDLAPDDGITADWAPDDTSWSTTFRYRYYFDLRDNVPPPEVEGDGSFSLGLGALGGSATAPGSSFYVGDDIYPEAQTLRLTPFTRVTVSVPYRLDIALEPEQPWGSQPPKALASLELLLAGINNLRIDPDSGEKLYDDLPFTRQYDELQSPWFAPVPGTSFREGVMAVTFDNNSATDALFSFRAELVAFGVTGNVAAVPEPSTWAFWLAGGGLLAWRVRRSRRP
jgi:hypothetical protein